MATIRKMTNSIQCRTPAQWWGETWREGFFTGNGVIGANVFGGAIEEKILINHADLQWQGRICVVPDISAKLRDVRKCIEEGEEASEIMMKAFAAKNFRPQPHVTLPLCLLKLKANNDRPVKDYSRVLNMANGEVSVNYSDGSSKITRNVFVSRANDTVVLEITKTGSKLLDYEFSFDIMDSINARTPTSSSIMPDGLKISYDKYFLYMSARNDNGAEYGAVARLNHYGGNLRSTSKGVRIEGASSIILYLKVFVDSNRDKEFSRLRTELSALKEPYDKLLKAHATLHSKLFATADLSFDENEEFIEDLIDKANNGNISPLLMQKLWKYGRYLMVTATEQGKLMNPYGLWSGSFKSQKSNLLYSGALQSAYRPFITGNMHFALENLFDYIDQRMSDYKDNAIRLFDCRGVYLPTIPTTGTGRVGSILPMATHFTGCGAMLASVYYQYARCCGNTKMLKYRALPFMHEVAVFYEDYLKLNFDGKYIIFPTCVPLDSEPTSEQEAMIRKDTTIDFALVKELLTNLIEGARICNVYSNEIPKWEEMLSKLPKITANDEGVISQFVTSRTKNNRDISMLYSALTTKVLEENEIKNYLNTARKLLDDSKIQIANNMANLAIIFIRLGQRNLAMECLSNLIRGCMLNNMAFVESDWRGMGLCGNEVWTPLQLQTNLTVVDAIQQMLLYSDDSSIRILPEIPNEWQNLQFEGLLTANGAEVDVQLNSKNSSLTVQIKTKKSLKFDLYLPEGTKKLTKSNLKLPYDTDSRAIYGIELNGSTSFVFKYNK